MLCGKCDYTAATKHTRTYLRAQQYNIFACNPITYAAFYTLHYQNTFSEQGERACSWTASGFVTHACSLVSDGKIPHVPGGRSCATASSSWRAMVQAQIWRTARVRYVYRTLSVAPAFGLFFIWDVKAHQHWRKHCLDYAIANTRTQPDVCIKRCSSSDIFCLISPEHVSVYRGLHANYARSCRRRQRPQYAY